MDLAAEVRSKPLGPFTPNYNILEPVRRFMVTHLSADAHEVATGRLFVSLTLLDLKGRSLPVNRVVSTYRSKDDLIQVIIRYDKCVQVININFVPKARFVNVHIYN